MRVAKEHQMERPFLAYKGDDPYIFVSYAHEDDALVYPELQRLKDQGFNIWYDEGISPGSTWRDEVALALTQCKVFLYYITPRSVGSSNCLKELNFSLSRERRILSVHLENTKLPIGLELSLSDMQAIMREDHPEAAYQTKLVGPMSAAGFRKQLARWGVKAKLRFPVNPHMLRHACGYALANRGMDTRSLQAYLGHRRRLEIDHQEGGKMRRLLYSILP